MKLHLSCSLCNEALVGSLEEMRRLHQCPHCQGEVSNLDFSLKSGDVIGGQYTLEKVVGKDEFGVRYLAKNNNAEKIILKTISAVMHQNEEARSRFSREIGLLSSIRHPYVTSVLDSGEDEGVFYLISEYEEGISLLDYVANQGVIPEKDAVNLVMPVVEALKYVWSSQQIVHRDMKMSKIFITDDNKVKISDLGLAKSLTDDSMELTGAGFTMGTPDYMSPEQVNGDELDFKADMYSLGLVFYEIVTGTRAFDGPIMEVLNRQLTEMPPLACEVNPKVSERCSSIIEKMIQKSKDDRFVSWEACIESLGLILDHTVNESDLTAFGGVISSGSIEGLESQNSSGIILDEDSLAELAENQSQVLEPIEAGFIIGNGYEIDRKIGEGSMGEIYLAFDEENDRLVQVKLLSPKVMGESEKIERFIQEMKITSSLSHENLLSVVEGGEDNGRYYLVTEYENGISFHDFIGRYAPLDEKEALNYLMQIAEVLAYAWDEKKLLHREIKPENILIKEDEKKAKLTDFGVAKTLDDDSMNLTGAGFTIGTPDYMSPEQVRGDDDIDFRSDMYAVGLVLYEALTGKKPFEAKNVMALMNMQMTQQHKPLKKVNPEVSDSCSTLLDRLLAKDRNQRFESWKDMLRAMKNVVDGKSVTKVEFDDVAKDVVAFPAMQTTASPGYEQEHLPVDVTRVEEPLEENGNKQFLMVGVAIVVVIIIIVAIRLF